MHETEHGTNGTGDEVLTSRQVTGMLGVDHFQLSRMVRSGKIDPLPWNPALEHPREYTFARAEVERVQRLFQERARQMQRRVAESRATYNAQAS